MKNARTSPLRMQFDNWTLVDFFLLARAIQCTNGMRLNRAARTHVLHARVEFKKFLIKKS